MCALGVVKQCDLHKRSSSIFVKRRLRSKTPTVKFGKYKGHDIYTLFEIDQQMTCRGRRPIEVILREPEKYVGSLDAVELISKLQERQRFKELIESNRAIIEARTARKLAALGLTNPLTGDEIVSELWAKHCTALKAIVGQPVKNILKQSSAWKSELVLRFEKTF